MPCTGGDTPWSTRPDRPRRPQRPAAGLDHDAAPRTRPRRRSPTTSPRWSPTAPPCSSGSARCPTRSSPALRGHRDLGVHTGAVGDELVDLIETRRRDQRAQADRHRASPSPAPCSAPSASTTSPTATRRVAVRSLAHTHDPRACSPARSRSSRSTARSRSTSPARSTRRSPAAATSARSAARSTSCARRWRSPGGRSIIALPRPRARRQRIADRRSARRRRRHHRAQRRRRRRHRARRRRPARLLAAASGPRRLIAIADPAFTRRAEPRLRGASVERSRRRRRSRGVWSITRSTAPSAATRSASPPSPPSTRRSTRSSAATPRTRGWSSSPAPSGDFCTGADLHAAARDERRREARPQPRDRRASSAASAELPSPDDRPDRRLRARRRLRAGARLRPAGAVRERASLGLPEARSALSPAPAATQLLTRVAGPRGRQGPDLHRPHTGGGRGRCGSASPTRLVADAELEEETAALAATIAANGPLGCASPSRRSTAAATRRSQRASPSSRRRRGRARLGRLPGGAGRVRRAPPAVIQRTVTDGLHADRRAGRDPRRRPRLRPAPDRPERERVGGAAATSRARSLREMGELGFFGCCFPERYGGSEAGFLSLVLVIEEIARVWQPAAGLLQPERDDGAVHDPQLGHRRAARALGRTADQRRADRLLRADRARRRLRRARLDADPGPGSTAAGCSTARRSSTRWPTSPTSTSSSPAPPTTATAGSRPSSSRSTRPGIDRQPDLALDPRRVHADLRGLLRRRRACPTTRCSARRGRGSRSR